jgi:hypothetical protein
LDFLLRDLRDELGSEFMITATGHLAAMAPFGSKWAYLSLVRESVLRQLVKASVFEPIVSRLLYSRTPLHVLGGTYLLVSLLPHNTRQLTDFSARNPRFIPELAVELSKSELRVMAELLVELLHNVGFYRAGAKDLLKHFLHSKVNWRAFLRFIGAFVSSEHLRQVLVDSAAIFGRVMEMADNLLAESPEMAKMDTFILFWRGMTTLNAEPRFLVRFIFASREYKLNSLIFYEALQMALEGSKVLRNYLLVKDWLVPSEFSAHYRKLVNLVPDGTKWFLIWREWNPGWIREMTGWIRPSFESHDQ